jgi:hypothetical protein
MATPTRRNLLQRLWSFFTTGTLTSADSSNLQGSQYPIGNRYRRRTTLPLPEQPVRPIYGDLSISQELIEMKTWSYEMRHAISFLARDCFQQIDGRSASWRIAEELDDGRKVHPDVLSIGRDIANRRNGKTLVLGGDRLQRAARDMMGYGDSFVELAIEREGIGQRDWGISRSLYLPSLSVFVDEDEHGEPQTYIQQERVSRGTNDIEIHPVKMLHFSYEKNRQYGDPLSFQSLEPWRKIKAASADLEDAAREAAIAPWLHLMPPEQNEDYRKQYQQRHESLLNDGVITNLYLMSGADVRKAMSGSDSLKPLVDYYLSLRYQMLPPGLPHYLFPGLGLESSSGKEIANQPALAYARMIANLRSLLGEQIRWAISLEIVLKKGFDFFVSDGYFDIVWSPWLITGFEQLMQQRQQPATPVEQALINASLLMDADSISDLPMIDAAIAPQRSGIRVPYSPYLISIVSDRNPISEHDQSLPLSC